jgi:hypothetical protein
MHFASADLNRLPSGVTGHATNFHSSGRTLVESFKQIIQRDFIEQSISIYTCLVLTRVSGNGRNWIELLLAQQFEHDWARRSENSNGLLLREEVASLSGRLSVIILEEKI